MVFEEVVKVLVGLLVCCCFDFAKLCWCCYSWAHRHCRVGYNVVSAIFPIVRLWPMFHLRLLRLCTFFVLVPMVVGLVVDVVEVLGVVVLLVGLLLGLWEVLRCVDCCCQSLVIVFVDVVALLLMVACCSFCLVLLWLLDMLVV